jgi:hypothetical protein
MRPSGRTTFQCNNDFPAFTTTYLIKILKIILFNKCNFRFTNIEAAKTITLTFKSSMEMLLFQWSQVFKHPEWKL